MTDINKNKKQLVKTDGELKTIEGKIIDSNEEVNRKAAIEALIDNIPTALSIIPGPAGALTGTIAGIGISYWKNKRDEKRDQEIRSFENETRKRLNVLEIDHIAIDYWENSLIFRLEDIQRKLLTEPGRGFDELLAEFVAKAISDTTTPPALKDLILSTILSIDSIDISVFKEVDNLFVHELKNGRSNGASFMMITGVLKTRHIDKVMVSRSLQRLQAQDLVTPLTTNTANIQELPSQEELYRGEKSPQSYSQGGFIVSAFGRQFLKFLKLNQ